MLAARVIAAIVSLLAWILASILPLGPLGWVAAVVVTVMTVLTAVLYERYVARTGGVRRRDLDAVVFERARTATPAMQVSLQALDADFREAVQRITGSIPGRTSTLSIEATPWFLVLGPTGVGKSSLLAASGQPFAWATAASGPHVHHPCRWWLADEAVYVNTSGQWCASETPSPEWLTLLALIEKNRPKQPIEGVILPVAADALAQSRPEELDALARILRARLDEITGYLGVNVPVHLVVTRMDSVPGFWDFFGDLRREERGQVWGATFPVGAIAQTTASERVTAAVDELVAVLTARRLRRLASERDPARRFGAYQFPQWVAGLRESLATLTAATFAHSVYQDPILFRGVYFATASADPMERDGGPGGAFTRDLFRAVIVPDRELAARSVAEVRRRRAVHHTVAAVLTSLAALTALLPLSAFKDNDNVITDLNAALDGVLNSHESPVPIARLDALRAQVAALQAWEDSGPPLHARFGMYVGDQLAHPAETFFGAVAYRDVVGPVVRRRATELSAFAARYVGSTTEPTAEERTYYDNALRLYVFLTTPRLPDDQQLADPTQREWFVHQLALAWGQSNPTAQATLWPTMNAICDLYARLLQSDARLASPRDLGLVARVRAVLARGSP